jgi:transposase
MLGISPAAREQSLFSYAIHLEQRIPAGHFLRQVDAALDLDFVIPLVREFYGKSGHVSLDPRVIMRMMLLLTLYNIPSERELMEQIPMRLDFLWFLGFDLETTVPDHSVLSKARARWGEKVFERLFSGTVQQCVEAGLVDGQLLHIDSTIVKANASKSSVVKTSPELAQALRQAYQQQADKLQVLAGASPAAQALSLPGAAGEPELGLVSEDQRLQVVAAAGQEPTASTASAEPPGAAPAKAFAPEVLPAPPPASPPLQVPQTIKRPVNADHLSLSDPEAQLARNKSGVTELNYKDHRLVDDRHGVITAVAATGSTVADGTQLVPLLEQHAQTTQLGRGPVAVAGDHHYGTADNYIHCMEQGIRPHLGEASAHVEQRGQLPLEQFHYEADQDRLKCPGGHYLLLHQNRPGDQAKVYRIEDPAHCAQCPLRGQCTEAKQGRSIQRHVQAELVEAARAEAASAAGRASRRRRQHVMEGSFADAANNHGSKRARWRGLGRQRVQSWLIAAVQNLRILVKRVGGKHPAAAAAAQATQAKGQIRTLFALLELWRRIFQPTAL